MFLMTKVFVVHNGFYYEAGFITKPNRPKLQTVTQATRVTRVRLFLSRIPIDIRIGYRPLLLLKVPFFLVQKHGCTPSVVHISMKQTDRFWRVVTCQYSSMQIRCLGQTHAADWSRKLPLLKLQLPKFEETKQRQSSRFFANAVELQRSRLFRVRKPDVRTGHMCTRLFRIRFPMK